MAYSANIPQPADNISASQSDLLNNFQALKTYFALDHNTWDATNAGLHKQVTIPNNSGADPGAAGTTGVYYAKTVSGVVSPYFQNAVGASVLWRSASGNGLVTQTTGGTPSAGTMTLPNGIIMKWGYVAGAKNGTVISFSSAFPSNCFSVQITGQRNSVNAQGYWVQDGTLTRFGFTLISQINDSIGGLYYWAIGN